jgi:serine/threonine protein phosphatase PrpC
MSENKQALKINSFALSDRGLNERRPLNEDSYLDGRDRNIFAVADGVGGAEAGEVASQTAVEVLEEAFRHRLDGGDIEDLMELAIQRANTSIHQMAQDHARFSMMATTIVALHIKGNTATFGHVGDSRLYRLTPDGMLHRETEDHSVVEEEVRAGRMTPEQAANHPSKNVISRALGAEDDVEVDMKTMEVEDGTEFILCTDGITRHVSDSELRQLLVLNDDLESVCRELKERCYERGAEDNLTVVLVRVGERISAHERLSDLEPTISPETTPVPKISTDGQGFQTTLIAPSRVAFPGQPSDEQVTMAKEHVHVAQEAAPSGGSGIGRFFGLLLVLVLLGGAFYAGARYKERIPFLATQQKTVENVVPAKAPDEPFLQFEKARRDVDRDPHAWITNEVPKELVNSRKQKAIESPNPEFLYLYGRASLLTGNPEEAAQAFAAAISNADLNPSVTNDTIRKEATLGLAAVSFKTQKARVQALAHYDELTKPPANTTSP